MRQWTVDAFATAPFRGNQACVLEPFDVWPDAAWMQALAAENNQAETAYLLKTDDPARFGLRWFTPALEVPLCGHATLASSHVLFAELGSTAEAITFDTQSGPLIVRRDGERYGMDFPATLPVRTDCPAGLARSAGRRTAGGLGGAIPGGDPEGRGAGARPQPRYRRPQGTISGEGHRRARQPDRRGDGGCRLALRRGGPLLRAGVGHTGRPGHRLRPLHPGARSMRVSWGGRR